MPISDLAGMQANIKGRYFRFHQAVTVDSYSVSRMQKDENHSSHLLHF